MKDIDEILYDALRADESLMEAVGGRIVSTCFEVGPDGKDNTPLPCIIVTDDNFQNMPETKDTGKIKHPAYVMEHVPYRQRVYRIMGWMNPGIKVARSFEELFLNLRYGNFSYIGQAIRNRIKKWLGRKEYN